MSSVGRSISRGPIALVIAVAVAAGATSFAAATPTPTTTTPSTTTTTSTTAAAPVPTTSSAGSSTSTTTTASTSTTTTLPAPPPNLLAGVNWIQQVYLSPCGDGTAVQMIGGAAVVNGARAVLDDVIALESTKGRALAFLSCHQPNGTVSAVVALPVTAVGAALTSGTPTSLGAGAVVVAASPHAFVVELPDPAAPTALWRHRTYTVGADGITLSSDRQISALQRSITQTASGGNAIRLVEGSVQPTDLCYAWNNVSLAPQDRPAPDATEPIPEPSAEIQTIRLALILLTDSWIDPASEVTPQMAAVIRTYQASRGLAVDGVIGPQTTDALRSDLGCAGTGSFQTVVPPELGPRRYATPSALLADAERYARTGHSTNPSLDALLAAAGWDGPRSFFLGCERYESPPAGLSCAWSGTTPLQLIGLVDDPASTGVHNFSVLYARSAAPAA